jgi:hypothetical protein
MVLDTRAMMRPCSWRAAALRPPGRRGKAVRPRVVATVPAQDSVAVLLLLDTDVSPYHCDSDDLEPLLVVSRSAYLPSFLGYQSSQAVAAPRPARGRSKPGQQIAEHFAGEVQARAIAANTWHFKARSEATVRSRMLWSFHPPVMPAKRCVCLTSATDLATGCL